MEAALGRIFSRISGVRTVWRFSMWIAFMSRGDIFFMPGRLGMSGVFIVGGFCFEILQDGVVESVEAEERGHITAA